jgi:hypothetical protein
VSRGLKEKFCPRGAAGLEETPGPISKGFTFTDCPRRKLLHISKMLKIIESNVP